MVKEGNSLMCHHHTCKQKRAILVNSQKVADFKCEHLQKMQDCTTALSTFEKYQGGNISYPCDDNTRKSLCELATECEAMQIPIAVQVSPSMYCVFGSATADSPTGYSHVRVTDTEIKCCSKNCRSTVIKAKQQRAKKVCTHIHVLLSLGIFKDMDTNNSPSAPSHLDPENQSVESGDQTKSRLATIELKMRKTIPYQIPLNIIQQAGKIDAHPSGWQQTFEPEQENCELCSNKLGPSKAHQGQRGRSVLITNMHPFKTVQILVKMCSNCSAMHQVFPYNLGK
jgi:hypothetical protein